MKKLFVYLLLMLPVVAIADNDDKIKELQQDLEGLDGKRYAKKCVKLSKLYFEDGHYDKAYDVAKMGYAESKRKHLIDYQGICLNQAAKVRIEQPNTTLTLLDRARSDLKLSAKVLRGSDLNKIEMDNTNLMRKLDRRVSEIKNPGEEKGVLGGLAENISSIFSGSNSGGSSSDDESGASTPESRRALELSGMDQDFLIKQLQAQEQASAQMSSEQLKQRFLLMQQNRMIDSMNLAGFLDSLELENKQFELKSKDIEIKEQAAELSVEKSQKRLFIALSGMIVLIAIGLLYLFFNTKKFNKTLQAKNEEIEHERQKADRLLLNILPSHIAQELKEKGHSDAPYFEEATIIFTDFKDFTKMSEKLTASNLVEELNVCFKAFDAISTKHNVEKIKTIGDAYMAVGGLSNDPESARNVVLAGLEMQEFIRHRMNENKDSFEMRVGVHSGPVVAGIVGDKKFQYDIWGDSVNTAARMESSGTPGKVNVSIDTYKRIKDYPDFSFESRGAIAAKNKGEIEMFYVTRA